MNLTITPNRSIEARIIVEHRRVDDALLPLDEIAERSVNLLVHRQEVASGATLSRYTFVGPKGGDEPLRIGIFAGIHGDEAEGVHALVKFFSLLEAHPELARGYCLFAYPVCNPTGFEDNTRFSRSGKDLNREFWRGSVEPEVGWLQDELVKNSFHGLIALHTDDTSHGFYGFVRGATLTKHLIEPALQAAGQILPLNQDPIIDGFPARNGVIRRSYPGILSARPGTGSCPFELILETPKLAPEFHKEQALVVAMQSILTEYRNLMAHAINL